MTNLQVEYWKNEEARRHNLVLERLTGEQQAEVVRHNVRQESIGFAQASASALQAQAAMKQAEIQYRLSQLKELETQSQLSLNMYHMDLFKAQAEYQRANVDYTAARTEQQRLESGVYSMYGPMLAAADLSSRTQQYYESSARTKYLTEQAETEAYRRAQLVTQAVQNGVNSVTTLFGNKSKDNKSSIFRLFK